MLSKVALLRKLKVHYGWNPSPGFLQWWMLYWQQQQHPPCLSAETLLRQHSPALWEQSWRTSIIWGRCTVIWTLWSSLQLYCLVLSQDFPADYHRHAILITCNNPNTLRKAHCYVDMCVYVKQILKRKFFGKVSRNIFHAFPVTSTYVAGLAMEEVKAPLLPNAL